MNHWLVTLPDGSRAVFDVQPQHIPREDIEGSKDWPRLLGRAVAQEIDGVWYRPDGFTEITDKRLVKLFEGCPNAA
jgi:hypothetical protein